MTNVTAQKIADMLTENTGSSMLDSGGYYGRHWERNAGKTLEDFISAPAGTIGDDGELSIDLFHYLNDLLEYEPTLDAAWRSYDGDRPNESWSENIETFLDMLGVPNDGDFYGGRWEFNTYNFDACLLTQTIQGTAFRLGNDEYLILQVHGGCDVRGGYTKPVIFKGDIESVIGGIDTAYLRCSKCEFYIDFCSGDVNDYHLPNSESQPDMLIEVTVPTEWEPTDDWNAASGCPIDRAPLLIQGR